MWDGSLGLGLGPHMCQVLQGRALVLGDHLVQQHPLGPVQGCGVLHQLHAVVQQGSTSTEQSPPSHTHTHTELTAVTVLSPLLLTFSELSHASDLLLL